MNNYFTFETETFGSESFLNEEAQLMPDATFGWVRPVQSEWHSETGELVEDPTFGYVRRVQSEIAGEQSWDREGEIIGADQRALVTNTARSPFRWICAFELRFPTAIARGTGTLISARHILTCGHNLKHNRLGSVRSITATPGMNGTRAPFGSFNAAKWDFLPDQWGRQFDPQFDFGLVTLPKPISALKQAALGGRPLGFWSSASWGEGTQILISSPQSLTGNTASISGYPGDKCGTQQLKRGGCVPINGPTGCNPVSSHATTQWQALGQITQAAPAATPRLLLYTADTFGGQSGSPIWVRNQSKLNLVAIHTGPRLDASGRPQCDSNRGVRLTTELWEQVRNWMRTGPDGRLRITLRQGARGQAVMEMQTRINNWMRTVPGIGLAPLKVDGIFGPKTNQAVLTFQRTFGLTVDGITGPQTWGTLLAF
ncbi:MAG: peptidoglycan-binding protein [Acidobacteria bacterium]|nr:peptidoglycan-binding protein [Acidobacteriota bacterium]